MKTPNIGDNLGKFNINIKHNSNFYFLSVMRLLKTVFYIYISRSLVNQPLDATRITL